ncbi:class E sortase [Beutenbergia cavernae]|nr:class E sortase [Beutenbergia cavernae]
MPERDEPGRHAPEQGAPEHGGRPSGDPGTRRRFLGWRTAVTGAAVALGAAALVLLPGAADDPADSPVARALEEREDQQPPTRETVDDLAADLRDIASEGYDQPIDPARVSAVVTQPGPYEAMGRIQIPAIGLDAEYGNGVHESALARGPGHWPGTPAPGQAGNAVISGHRTTHTAPFRDLDDLVEGDEIVVSTGAAEPVTYVVVDTVVVPVESYTEHVLAPPDDATSRELTLFACHPEGSLANRIVVHARAGGAGDA